MSRKPLLFFFINLPLIAVIVFFIIFLRKHTTTSTGPSPILTILPTPTPTPIEKYISPKLPNKDSYTLIFTGDSMTQVLGPNLDQISNLLKTNYLQKTFGLFNYGFGSTNILSLPERFHKQTTFLNQDYPAILDRYFDIIFIESMGYNPLSQFPLDQGLQQQTKILDQITSDIVSTHPNSLIIFVATITPSSTYFGKGVLDLTPVKRRDWANERRAYIENHINYALKHNYPLIDIYHASQDTNSNGLLKYINSSDYIHPSVEGVLFISQQIVNFLASNHILPTQ